MANRLERILAMDKAVQARNAPKQGMQTVVNADGSVTNIPYTEDRRGRRTVMTPSGPKVIRGHEGKSDPYANIGRGLGNILGGLFGKTSPPYLPPKTDYFDMSQLGPKPKTSLDTIELPDGSFGIKKVVTDAAGNPTLIITDPNTGATLYDSSAPAAGLPKATVAPSTTGVAPSTTGNAQGDTATSGTSRFTAKPKSLTEKEQLIQDNLPDGVSVDGRPGTRMATREERRAAREQASRTPKERPDIDPQAAGQLSEAERNDYLYGNITDQQFNKLHNKALFLQKQAEASKEEPSFEEKERIKKEEARLSKLQSDSAARTTSLNQAKLFLKAFEGDEKTLKDFGFDSDDIVDSGAGRSAATYIPGVYTAQGRFDEQFSAFAEQAARQTLKALGEVRPTDADVEGAKKALFGIGKDEETNRRLLRKYIQEQEYLEQQLKDLKEDNTGGWSIKRTDNG